MNDDMKKIVGRLKKHTSPTSSKWREELEYMEASESWLWHSQRIAMQMLDKMDETGITRKQLAERMKCSPQYISKVLKGRENLSLETLSKIEKALGIFIIREEPVSV